MACGIILLTTLDRRLKTCASRLALVPESLHPSSFHIKTLLCAVFGAWLFWGSLLQRQNNWKIFYWV